MTRFPTLINIRNHKNNKKNLKRGSLNTVSLLGHFKNINKIKY